MLSLNKVFLIGNLTRDPRLRSTPSGISVGEFSIAVNDMYTTSNGDRKERTVFVDIVVWKRLAETCNQYLEKGRAVLVEGRLEQDTWEDRETGQRRSRIRVVAQNVTFLYRPGEDYRKGQGQRPQQRDKGRDFNRRDDQGDRGRGREEFAGRDDYNYDENSNYNNDYPPYEDIPPDELESYGLSEDDKRDIPGDDEVPF